MKQGGTSRSRTMGTRLACGVKAYPTPMVRTEQQARFFLSIGVIVCPDRPDRVLAKYRFHMKLRTFLS
jgi:hypothetical protein